MAGTATRLFTTAYPMRWVKLTLPPVARNSWLLMMVRLTSKSLAGTTLTLVAVGTSREACMLVTMRPAAPRSGVTFSPADVPLDAALGGLVFAAGADFAGVGAGAGAPGAGTPDRKSTRLNSSH